MEGRCVVASVITERSLLDHAAAELGFEGTQALGDRELALALLAAYGLDIDRAIVGPSDPTPLRDAPTAHLVRRARIWADTAERDERSMYPNRKAVW